MFKFVPILVAILVLSVSWMFFTHFSIEGWNELHVTPRSEPVEPVTLDRIKRQVAEIVERSTGKRSPAGVTRPGRRKSASAIRVATLNVRALNHETLGTPEAIKLFARIGQEFDILAIQQLSSDKHDVLSALIARMNNGTGQYDFVVGPRVGPDEMREQFAFVFDRRTVTIDRNELYTVDDRSNSLTFEPFVGWFRTVAPPEQQAFTFSLVNLRIDPATALQERAVLDDLLVAVQNDGRDEDDVILAGDFQAGPGSLGEVDEWDDIGFAVENVPTNVAEGISWDNFIFKKTATREFTGVAGVLDFLREYNLTLEQALMISEHLMVWAEFSIYEGGGSARIARMPLDQPTDL